MQERILNFDSLLRNVYLKTSSNPEAEKILKKNRRKSKRRGLYSLQDSRI